MGGQTDYNYEYDDLYRLTNATGSHLGSDHENRYSLKMRYNSVHSIIKKEQVHQFKGYDETEWSPRNKTTYTYDYEYGDSQPHAPVHIGEQTYSYDANGNQTGWTHDKSGQEREILWDEENRIKALADNGQINSYVYDAAGERVLKSHGGGQNVRVNGKSVGGQGSIGNYTIYVNPYVVVRNSMVTKHFYIGAQRVSTKLTESSDGLLQEMAGGTDTRKIDYANKQKQSKASVMKLYADLGLDVTVFAGNSGQTPNGYAWGLLNGHNPGGKPSPDFGPNTGSGGNGKNTEAFVYYYHPDHLGSSSYITDANGEVSQHVEYFAFGETFLEEHSNADRTPYLYNGKELDEETGLYYYGARYYDAKTSIWQSVDPLAEMYPGWSPYAYTMQNPLRYVDPTGMSTEDSSGGCGCPEPPCGDKKLYPFTAGKQQLPEVIVDAPGKSNSKSRSSNKNYSSSMSFSGEMPHYLKYGENPVTWDSPYESGTLDQYNEDWGTNYTEGNSWNQWYYDTKWKPQYDNLISNIHSAQLQVGLVTLSVPIAVIGGAEAAPILAGGIQNLYAASLSGYSASLSFGNTAYYAINVEANAIMETGAGLWSRYMLNIMGGAQTYMLPQYNFNIDVVGPTGNFIYGNLSGAPSLEVLFNH